MKTYAQQAETRRIELIAGLISVRDVIAWADQIIASHPEYDDDIANLSLAGNKTPQDIESDLHRLAAGAEPFEAIRVVMGRMHDVLLADASRARDFTRVLEHLWVQNDFEVPEDMQFIVGIDDEFSLAEQGIYGTVAEATASLIEETGRFKEHSEQENGEVFSRSREKLSF